MQKTTVPQISKKTKVLTRRASGLMALEQRFMFDGAAVDTAMDAVSHPDTLAVDAHPLFDLVVDSKAPLGLALQQVQTQVRDAAANWSDAQWMDVFGIRADDAQALATLHDVQRQIQDGSYQIHVVEVDAAQMGLSMAAFAAKGPDGQPTVFLNKAWWSGAEQDPLLLQALMEEVGHSIDAALHPEQDTAGDEGQLFAMRVLGLTATETQLAQMHAENDAGQLSYNGEVYQVEHASFNFTTAYQLAPESPRYEAEKEQESDRFLGQSLGVASINDNTGLGTFSGNDVVVDLTINGTTYHGWISRPIKDQGIVRGFYFWYDPQFTSFALASADGNQDGDSIAADNRGFVLVVDKSWFSTITSGTPIYNNGSVNTNVYEVGSSSDRVDSALNSVLTPNSAPTAANDSLTVNEDSGTTTVSAANGLLSNDSDANNDALIITGYTISGVSGTQTVGSTVTISGVGAIHINADGSYTFAPVANYTGSVPPITYTLSDGNGGTSTAVLSITVTPVNDAPTASDDSITTSENTPKVLALNDFGTFSDPENDPEAKIQITQLATNGSLQYWNGSSWTAVTLNQQITVAQILQGQLRFAPDANENGSNYATVQFKVSDGQTYSSSSYTLTVNVTAGNQAPVAVADTNIVAEEGCGVAAAPATGNVLTDGTRDSDFEGQTLTVSSITYAGGTLAVSGSGATTIKGQYGTLTIYANGVYSYALNNTLAAIDAMNSGNTKTDAFTYTVSDGTNTSSTTLTLTINGTNDDPVAADDFRTFIEETNASAGNHGTVTGNALTNDKDVDNTNGDLTVELVGGTTPSGASDVILSASSPISSVTIAITQVSGSWTAIIPDNSAQPVWLNAGYTTPALDKAGNQLTVIRSGSGQSATLIFSDNVALYNYELTNLYVKDPGNSNYTVITVDITSATTSSSATISTTSSVSGIQSGYTVSGTGIPVGTTVVSVDSINKTITLSQAVNIANTSLTFHDPNAVAIDSSTQEYFQGTYGYLILNENGSYTYTLTTDIAASVVVTDQFTYTAKDPANCTDTAVITIRVTGVDAPKLANDTLVVSEDSGTHVTFNGSASTVNESLKTNDANGTSITLGDVTSFKVAGDSSTYTAGSTAIITGVGTLSIAADGTVAFDPVNGYLGPVPTVTYTRVDANAANSFYTANLTITIQAVDNASVLAADTKTVPEDTTATGNVLANDMDVDSVLSVTSFSYTDNNDTVSYSAGATGREIRDGSYNLIGTITINANGSYSFSPAANWNGTVPTITYITNTNLTSTLDITVNPVNDAPTLDLDGNNSSTVTGNDFKRSYTNAGSAVAIGDTDVAIADIDDTNIESAVVVLTNPQSGDVLNIGGSSIALTTSGTLPSGTLSNGIAYTTSNTNGVITISLLGSYSLASYQDAIKAITFSSSGTSTVDRVVSVKVNDGDADSNTAYTTINVSADNRLVTVMGSVVNEASPYVMFEVSGVQNQYVSLVLGTTGNTTGHATMGVDFLPNLEYLVGSTWTAYTGGLVQIADVSGKLLFRTAVLQDTPFESTQDNYETLKLTAKNAAGTSNVSTNGANFLADGTARIRDDGQGDIYLSDKTTFNPSTPLTYLDDDRPVTVNSIVVNEASPYAVLTISGYSGQVLNLAWTDLTAKKDANSSGALDGTDDYGPSLQYWDPTAGSSGDWVDYNSSVTMSGSSLFVRTSIINDNPYEGLETFALEVTKVSSGTKVYGSVSVVDDGTGTKYPNDDPADGVATDTNSLNDDRTITVTGGLTFNEASPYATFTVSAVAGAEINLTLGTTGSGTGHADISGFVTSYSEDGGATWIAYTWNGTTGNRPTVPANGAGSSLYGTVLVRVNIASEEEGGSDVYEGAETFTLTANYVTNNAITSTGTDTIVDDGTGRVDRNGDGDTGDSNEGTGGPGAGYEDDRTIDVVGGITFNEASTYGTFTVTGAVGSVLNLELGNTPSTSDQDATIANFSMQYNTGSGWVTYTWNGSTGNRPTVPAGGTFTVRVNISSEIDSPYEGAETFTLKAIYATNSSISDADTDTIIDDGTGKIDNDGDGGSDEGGSKDDDRPLTVNNIRVNEGSPFAVFTVTGKEGQQVKLNLGNGTATMENGNGTVLTDGSEDFGPALQHWNGSAWTNYTANSFITIPSDGDGTAGETAKLLVRTAVNPDALDEGDHTFTLTATNTGGSTGTGTATIDDHGGGVKYPDAAPSNSTESSPVTDNTNLDDDRSGPITVTGGTYNENSPRAVFTVNANPGQVLTLDVQNAAQSGKAPTGDNEGKPNDSLDTAPIYYSLDGGATWQLYTGPVTAGSVPVLVAVDITNERDDVYEGEEQLKLVVTSGNQSASDYASIFDDGTGDITAPIDQNTRNNAGANDPAVVKDDDRPKAALPPPPPAPAAPPAPPAEPIPLPPVATPPQAFSSTLAPLAPRLVPVEPPMSLGEVLTSNSGYPIPVSETAPVGLTINRGVTDQFIQSTDAASKISLPFDAFIHSNKDAVIKLEAKNADNSPLPQWVQFDPSTGVFEVTPPKGFKGKLDLKVIARDDDGREAVAMFQMFVGEQTTNRVQSRDSFSEKLRLAGKRPITLVRVADSAKVQGREGVAVRVRAG